jgi:membrane protease YdiL (CAAX protease family)
MIRLSVIGRVFLFIFLCGIGLAMAGPLAKDFPGWRPELLIGLTTALWALGLTTVFVRWEDLALHDVGAWPDRRTAGRLSLGLLIGMALIASWAANLGLSGRVHWVPNGKSEYATACWAFLGFAALSCREELAFHGYALRRLKRTFGVWPAQLLVALVFVAEHRLGARPGQNHF